MKLEEELKAELYKTNINFGSRSESKEMKEAIKRFTQIAEEFAIEKQIEQLNKFAEYWDLKNDKWFKDELDKLK